MNETLAVLILFVVRIILPLVILLVIGVLLHRRQEKIEQKMTGKKHVHI